MNAWFTINLLYRWYTPWFYKHAETYLNSPKPVVEYVPTVDFFHRHNKAFFWMMPTIVPFANHPVFRYRTFN